MSTNDFLEDITLELIPADKGLRFANLLIDTVIIYGLIFLIFVGIAAVAPSTLTDGNGGQSIFMVNVVPLLIYILYFALVEGATNGKTLGKLITGTRAMREDGAPITFGDTFKRSLSRIVPFEPFSALSGRPWHDKWTDTVVVKEHKG